MGFSKLWADLDGQPLLAHAIAIAEAAHPAELIIVVSRAQLAETAALAPRACVVPGGARRRDSVAAGLAAATAPWLAIHEAARETGAAVPAVPLKDTIKRVADGRVVATPARAEHVVVQTPQIFRRDLLERALALSDDDVTDEAALLEQLGISVAIFDGDERAFKVTSPLDFALVRALLA